MNLNFAFRLGVPIDNFVSNFIFMEDEPEVEQPDHSDQMIHQQLLLDDDDDDEDEELPDEDLDDDEEDDKTDISQLHDVSIGEALNDVVKGEIFCHDQPQAKKSELDLIGVKKLSTNANNTSSLSSQTRSLYHNSSRRGSNRNSVPSTAQSATRTTRPSRSGSPITKHSSSSP